MDGTRVYLALGSNVGDREENLRAAVASLREGVAIDTVSSLYETAPYGVTDQPPFFNLALSARTRLAPHDLLLLAKRVERHVGRTPTYRWGPRVVDVDILLFGDRIVDEPDLIIPHADMLERAFVLVPLAEIAPEVVHPRAGRTIADLAAQRGAEGIRRVGTW